MLDTFDVYDYLDQLEDQNYQNEKLLGIIDRHGNDLTVEELRSFIFEVVDL